MSNTRKLRILFTGDYLPDYNRTSIIRSGLLKLDHEVIDFPFRKKNCESRKLVQGYAKDCDFIFMPSFTHQQVRFVRKAVGKSKKIIFDPLISRYLTKVHDYQLVSPYGLSALRNYFRDKWSMQAADFVITDTKAHLEYYHKIFAVPREKMGTVYIGNDFQQFYPKSEQPQNSKFVVGFYGGFIPLQGVLNIIDSAALLKNDFDIEFRLIGNGFQFELAQEKIKNLDLKNVILPGWLTPQELLKNIQNFDLALGIFGETEKSDMVIPNKVYHYASCKKPIISKDSLAIRELFKPNVNIVLIDPNPKNIADEILKLKADPSMRNRIAEEGYKILKNNWDEVAVAKKLLSYAGTL